MRFASLGFMALAGFLAVGAASAASLAPVQSRSIDLGSVAGDAYYTVEQDGFHVVATFAQRDGTATPVRVQAVLSPGQAVTFSTPRAIGEKPVSVTIGRQGERVVVDDRRVTE